MNMKRRILKSRDFDLQIKAVREDGLFSGYASVFGVVDSYDEVVEPGAFKLTLAEMQHKGRPLPVLWQHSDTVGVLDSIVEDETGLYVEGRLAIGKVNQADEAHALMLMNAVSGLSFGYFVRESNLDEKTGIRHLTRLDLVEVSIVTFPANDEARIDAVKAKLEQGELPTLREFEEVLRDAGFSKSQAPVVAKLGLGYLLDRRDSGSTAKQVSGLLSSFSLQSRI